MSRAYKNRKKNDNREVKLTTVDHSPALAAKLQAKVQSNGRAILRKKAKMKKRGFKDSPEFLQEWVIQHSSTGVLPTEDEVREKMGADIDCDKVFRAIAFMSGNGMTVRDDTSKE